MPGSHKLTNELGCRLGEKGPRSGVLTPAPCEKYAKEELNILQLNINGLQNKKIELVKLLQDKEVHIALLQETILPKKKKTEITIPGYSKEPCTCKKTLGTNCQGIMTLIRNDITGKTENLTNNDIDWQKTTIRTKSRTKFTIHNMYCPPGTNSGLPLINEAKTKTIIAGDFNAHLPELGYERYNKMGREVEALNIENHIHLLQNEQSQPTCLHRRHGTTSRPDLTFVSADIHNKTNIKIMDDIGNDHLPILTTIDLRQQKRSRAQRKTFWNFKKANWKAYIEKKLILSLKISTKTNLSNNSTYLYAAQYMQQQRKLFHKATVKKFKAFWTSEISDAVKQRQKARKTAEKDPSTQNKREYNKLTAKVRHLTKSAKQEAWKNNCKKLDLNYREGHKTWRLLNNLEGKSIKNNPQPLIQDGKEIVCDKRKAEKFNKYFAN